MGQPGFFTSAAKGKCLNYFVSLIPDVPKVVTAIHLIALGTLVTRAFIVNYQRRKVLQKGSPAAYISLEEVAQHEPTAPARQATPEPQGLSPATAQP